MATYTINNQTYFSQVTFTGDPVNTITITNSTFFSFDVNSEGGADSWTVTDSDMRRGINSGLGDDNLTIQGATSVSEDLNAGGGDDVVTITGTTVIGTSVWGGTGDDTINVGGDARIGWNGVGLPPYSQGIFLGDGSSGADQTNAVNVTGNATIANIYGTDGADTIIIDGTDVNIGYWVTGNGGVDVISVDGTVTLGAIQGEGGATVAGTGTGDTITIEAGSDVTMFGIGGGVGDDIISVYGSGSTLVSGGGRGYPNVSYYEGVIRGDAGNDTITVGETFAVGGDIEGGTGSDTISVIGAASVGGTITGGDNADIITISSTGGNFSVDGGAGAGAGTDNDTLDIRGLVAILGAPTTVVENPDGTGSFNGSISFSDGTTITFSEIENVIVCFAAGTLITTINGENPIEDIEVGDLVLTADNGYQPVRWMGRRKISGAELEANPALYPIRIKRGAIGPSLPNRDLVVSPQHRIMIKSPISARMFEADEVLIAAKHLTDIEGIDIAYDVEEVEYLHFLFSRHEVVYAEGVPTESLYTGNQALCSLPTSARTEIFTIFPELLDMDVDRMPAPARLLVKGRRGRNLAKRHHANHKPLFA